MADARFDDERSAARGRRARCGRGSLPIATSKQGRFQIIDVVSVMRPVTKFARQIVDANNIPSLVRGCFRIAEEEKPGPVHLELPEGAAGEHATRTPFEVTTVSAPGASEVSLRRAASMSRDARRPLLLVASGANRNLTHGAVREFVESTGMYLCTTQMGKGVVDERHPRCLGTAALSDSDHVHCAIDRADLIIDVGHDACEKPPFFMRPGGPKVIHVAFFPAQIDDTYFPQHEVLGCMTSNVRTLSDLVGRSGTWDFEYSRRS